MISMRSLEVLGDPVAMFYYPAPFDRDGVAAWIEWAHRAYRENEYGLWAVIRRSDGRFLGDCGPMLQPVEDQGSDPGGGLPHRAARAGPRIRDRGGTGLRRLGLRQHPIRRRLLARLPR